MRVAIGSDHRGYALKQALLTLLQELGHEHPDLGCFDSGAVDYPDIAQAVGQAVAAGRADHGILICGSGLGMAMAANKIPGVRAAPCHDSLSARMTREHNDANVLCLGADILGVGLAQDIVRAYLAAQFQGGRHTRRVEKIANLEGRPTRAGASPA
ncbi:MAG: ribose 5-phosphate isomerase B [Dehalococcoidia bacterium]|nr:ribose 5-phosphate isomerase B [Dehalococcoidia bacterium]